MDANHKNGSKNGKKNGGDHEKKHEHSLTDILLRAGNWRELFTDQAFMIIVSDALNECVVNKVFTLAGYLISGRRVFLAIYPKGADTEMMLFLFYDSIRKAAKHFIEGDKFTGQQTSWERDQALVEEMLRHPFYRQYCVNDYLEKLVTGRRVNLPYYSAYLDALKVTVRQSTFCSAIEYRGGEGPVIIEKLKKTLH